MHNDCDNRGGACNECRQGKTEAKERPIGWLFHTGAGFAVKCWACAAKGLPDCVEQTKTSMSARGYTPIYHVNIHPYRQTCFDCTVTLVQGQSPAWCELFTGE